MESRKFDKKRVLGDRKPKGPFKAKSDKKVVPEGRTVYIGNLSYNRDNDGVKALVEYYGVVKFVDIIKDSDTGLNKGYAFVKMEHTNDAIRVVRALNGKDVDGRTLKASIAIENKKVFAGTGKPKFKNFDEDSSEKEEKVVQKRKKKGLNVLLSYLNK